MRLVAGCLLVAAANVVPTQSSHELHNRYGEPDIERFTARPGISLTVEYGSDHLTCQILIEPPQSLIHQDAQASLMSSEGVSEVLEDIVPVAMRGKEISTVVAAIGRNEERMTDYENVSIMRSTSTCDPASADQDMRTVITFKRDICTEQTK